MSELRQVFCRDEWVGQKSFQTTAIKQTEEMFKRVFRFLCQLNLRSKSASNILLICLLQAVDRNNLR